MNDDTNENLMQLKSLNWQNSFASFYVVSRRLSRRVASYRSSFVDISQDIQVELKKVMSQHLSDVDNAEEYQYQIATTDRSTPTMSADRTDFQSIVDDISALSISNRVTQQEEIFNAWFYVVRFDLNNVEPLFAVRKVPRGWTTKRSTSIREVFFSDDMQLEFQPKVTFRIDSRYDFAYYKGDIFIFDIPAFERDLNFRNRLMQEKSDAISKFESLRMFESVAQLDGLIGDNMRRLRKLAQVIQLEYYRDSDYRKSLKTVNDERQLGLDFNSNGQLIVSAEKIDLILHLFTNGRLQSIINDDLFDVDTKRKVEVR